MRPEVSVGTCLKESGCAGRSYVAMARPARHKIELSGQERVVLERRARGEKLPFQDVQRARIVLYAARAWRTPRSLRGLTLRRGWWVGGEDGSPSSGSRV